MINVCIYGAGSAGSTLASSMSRTSKYNLIAIFDSDSSVIGSIISGHVVQDGRVFLDSYLSKNEIHTVILSTQKFDPEFALSVFLKCKNTGVELKVINDFSLTHGKLSVDKLHSFEPTDLLGRTEKTRENIDELKSFFWGKSVLITGAVGSIGLELVAQVSAFGPCRIIMNDINENSLYLESIALKRYFPEVEYITVVGSFFDDLILDKIFSQGIDYCAHCAAFKHVPLMQDQPALALKNNTFGTIKLARRCIDESVKAFSFVSTDKAVNPTSYMGASKRLAEIAILDIAKDSKCRFTITRFGNVLGSNGSVVPIFQRLINEGRNLTLTHPEVTRYFMSISEAVHLILQVAVFGSSDYIYVLKMGSEIKLLDLARNMIDLSGKVGIDIDIVGLRPGEKLYEELFYSNDNFESDFSDDVLCASDSLGDSIGASEIIRLCGDGDLDDNSAALIFSDLIMK